MRYLFCSLDTHGFLYPAIGLALQLMKRGHEVAFAASHSVTDVLTKHDILRIPRGKDDGYSFQTKLITHPHETVRQIRHIQHALQTFAPHVLIGQQLCVGPLIAGQWYHLPVAVIGQAAYMMPEEEMGVHETPQSTIAKRAAELHTSIMAGYNAALKMYRLPEVEITEQFYAHTPLLGDAFLVRSVPELQQNLSLLPKKVYLIGDCLWEPEGDTSDLELEMWLQAAYATGSPILYVQPGRAHNGITFWYDLIEALRGKSIYVVASVGRMEREVGELPINFYVRPHVPQEVVMPYAAGVICSGTTTPVLGALTHGLPVLLVFTGDGEQPHIHDRCEYAGVSVSIHLYDSNPERLRDLVDVLLTKPQLHRNALRLKNSFLRYRQKEEGVNVVENLARAYSTQPHTFSRLSLSF